uniref:Uncharacterized protein n=1 Tax=Corvus moneduloides TaxID=1196302 RepID=A0A8C3DUP1_CORMO
MAGSGEALVLHVLLCCLCQGVATIECRGHVWIEPAPVVRMGSDISITCRSALDCPSAQLLILLNYSRTEETPLVLDGSTVRLRLRDFRMPFATVACFSLCASNHRHRLVCGAEVRAGYPPDPPGNLSCAIAEGSECLQCAWDAGRDTHLPTRHSLHLRRLADDEDEEEEKTFPADSPVLLRELHNASHYSVWVQASNALGTARSAPRHLSLQELVVPALPVVIGAETTETSPPSTTTRWRSRTQLQNVHCGAGPQRGTGGPPLAARAAERHPVRVPGQVPAQHRPQPLERLEPPLPLQHPRGRWAQPRCHPCVAFVTAARGAHAGGISKPCGCGTLGTRGSGGLGSAGEWLGSVVPEGFSGLTNSMIFSGLLAPPGGKIASVAVS